MADPPLLTLEHARPAPEVLREQWRRRFGGSAERAFFAPGRVNLLGAHLDYNEGFVLPMALDRGTYVFTRRRRDGTVRLESVDREPGLTVPAGGLPFAKERGWANYPLGVLAEFGGAVGGLDMLFAGDLPIGAGLSSSASILVATATALNAERSQPLSTQEVVKICHRAEVRFVGVQCGIMDPYASAFGEKDHVLHLDCRTVAHRTVPLDSSKVSIVVCDTMRRRELSDGRFNRRVEECAVAVQRVQELGYGVRTLRDVSREMLEEISSKLDPILARRVRHVVTEIDRTARGAEALTRGDLAAFGSCLRDSHESCRSDYEVSSRELDILVGAANREEGCHGARLTGAGFGGCCVAVVRNESLERFRARVSEEYERSTGTRPRLFDFKPSAGAREIERFAVEVA